MRNKALLAFFIFLSFFATLGYYPLFNLDEGAFSEATREMLASGDFITTYLNGQLRFDKPILIYWLQAISVKLFGLNEYAVRLPSALAATLWAMAIFIFAKRYLDERKAFWATLFMVGSLQITIIAKAAIADSLLNLFIATSMFCFFIYTQTRQKRALYATFALIALGTLTKGPIAIMIPFVISLLFLRKELLFWLKSILDPIGIAIFLAIAAPWYIAEYIAQGDKFIQGFILKHNIGRFSSAMEGHRGTILYYIPVLLVGLLPFTSIAIKAFVRIKEWFATPLQSYLGLWFLFVFLFFSLSSTKLPHYIVYGYTPLFILMALFFERIRSGFLLVLPFLLFSLLMLSLPFLKPLIVEHLKPHSYEKAVVAALHFPWSYTLFFVSSTLVALFAMKLSKERATLLMAFLTLVGVNLFIAKVYANAAEEPIKRAALFAKKHHLQVVMDGINTPSFSFYRQAITPKRKPKAGEVVLTKKSHLQKYGNYAILYEKNGIVLAKIKEGK